MKKILLALLIISSMNGCTPVNYFSEFYNDEGLEESEFQRVNPSENILVIETTDLDKRLNEYYKRGYVTIGFSHFKAPWCPRTLAIDTAKEKGASIVVISSNHLQDMQYSYAIPISVPHTTYHQGQISSSSYTSGHISGINGTRGVNYNGTTTEYASFTGTSTTYTTEYIRNSYTVGYFEQIAFFLAPKASVVIGE